MNRSPGIRFYVDTLFPWVLFLSLMAGIVPARAADEKPAPKHWNGEFSLPDQKLDQPDRILHEGDLMQLTLKIPGRTYHVLEKIEKNGDVATPDGSFISAANISLKVFKENFQKLYADIPGYEQAETDAAISSSPYGVILPPVTHTSSTNPPPPVIVRRIFKSPLTLWKAVQLEGGLPQGVSPHAVQILKRNLERKTFDCSGKDGAPDGSQPIESGDYLFLVPPDTAVSRLFDRE